MAYSLYRAWVSIANVQPFSDHLACEMQQKHSKNNKLQRAIREMEISVQYMKKKVPKKMNKNIETEKRSLRSSNTGKQNCTTVQLPVNVLDKKSHSMQIQRHTNITKENNKIETELHITSRSSEKKHYLRSTCIVSDSQSKQSPKNLAKRHHKVSKDENPPQKRARKSNETKKSPIATRTRTRLAILKQAR